MFANIMKQYIPFCFLAFLLFYSCKNVPKQTLDDQVLFSVEGEPVTAEEFMYVYEKNNFNNDSIYTKADIEEYLDLFVNFKLKVKQAEEEGYDTTEAFTKEFTQYKSQLLKPYLAESKAIDDLVKEAYERSKYLINASHILIRTDKDASPEDTLKAYKKAKEIQQKARNGADFGQLAKEYSEDPSAKQNSGNLGYFSVFKMVYPFETAAYNTPVDSISDIVKTQFGYHILKIQDKKPTRGTAKVAHIMIGFKNHDSIEAQNMAFELYDQLKAGADWNKLCSEFSDDVRTKNRGGELSPVQDGQMPPQLLEFENAVFNLDSSGQISDPVETPYGWHIIKLIEKKPPQPFDEVKDNLESKVKRDSRAAYTKAQVIKNLKKKSGFKENTENYKLVEENIDSTLIAGTWKGQSLQNNSSTLFTVSNKNYTVGSFIKFIKKEQKKRSRISPNDYLKELYDEFVENSLIDFEEVHIKQNNKDYRMLVKEYREGILLFDMMDKYVWSKASSDSAGIRNFYDHHKNKYMWNERARATIVSSDSEEVLDEVNQRIDDPFYTLETDTLTDYDNLEVKVSKIATSYGNAYKNMDDTFINILFNGHTGNELMDKVIQLFENQGFQQDQIKTGHTDASTPMIFQLNSRSKQALEKLYNTSSTLTLQVEEGKYEKGEKEIFEKTDWQPGTYNFDQNGRKYLIHISKILPPHPKELNETRGKVISDYQDQLEDEWVSSLKEKYTVQINQDVLTKIINHFEK